MAVRSGPLQEQLVEKPRARVDAWRGFPRGRGLRKMHPPIIEDDGSASLTPEELYVIAPPSFAAVLEQIRDLVEERKSDEIDHRPEYVAVAPLAAEGARAAADVRLVRIEGMRHGARGWRQDLDVGKLPRLQPRVAWHEELDRTLIQTWLKKALEDHEGEGQQFTLAAEPSYRDFDHVIELAYAIPILRELRAGSRQSRAASETLMRKRGRKPPGFMDSS